LLNTSETQQLIFIAFQFQDSSKSHQKFDENSSKNCQKRLTRKLFENFIESLPISLQENFWFQLENRILAEPGMISEKYYDVIGGILNKNTR